MTLRCPVRVKGGPVIPLIPGEEKEVTFQAVDFKDEPLTSVEATGFELDPQAFGQLSHGREDIIPTPGTDGVIRELMVQASPDAQGMAEVICRICEDTPEDLLGEDEDGQPLYYPEEEKIGIHTKQMHTDNSCGITYSAMPMPQVEVPLHLDQYLFPAPLLTMISSGCYGLGREFELMNINKYRQMFRKLNKEGNEFDEFTMEKDFSLDPGTRADCWELDDAGLNYSGRTDVYMYIESGAEVLRGKFDLSRHKNDDELRLEADTPAYLKHIIPDIPEPPLWAEHPGPQEVPPMNPPGGPPSAPAGDDAPGLFMYDSDGNPIFPEKFLENLND
ncbi:MAG: hypothetical protein ACLFRC_09200 [Desulfonatronovibrionaceae bacterium]